jgi:hypothetical protein
MIYFPTILKYFLNEIFNIPYHCAFFYGFKEIKKRLISHKKSPTSSRGLKINNHENSDYI